MSHSLYENDWVSAQTDPVPGYLAFQAEKRYQTPVTPNTILDKLDDNFSIFRRLVNRSRYRDLLNDISSRITVFAFPDSVVPDQLRKAFANLDYGDTNSLIQAHILDDVRQMAQLRNTNMLVPTRHPVLRLQTLMGRNLIRPWGTASTQAINVLNEGSMFRNGIVLVIDQPIVP